MSAQKNTQTTPDGGEQQNVQQQPNQGTAQTGTQGQNDGTDAAKESKGASLTPDQKHQNYLETLEKLHSEP